MSTSDQSHSVADLYTGYAKSKGWSGAPSPGSDLDMDFLAKSIGMDGGALLEIGFGNGDILSWAASRGYSVTGFEIQPDLVAHALARGHQAFAGPFDASKVPAASYDFVVIFDVAEHLTIPELLALLRDLHDVLRPGGRILLRAPNTASPFGLRHQNGDVTHRSCLSIDVLKQIATLSGYQVEKAIKPRTYPAGLLPKARRWAAYRLRDAIELAVGFAYFGGRIDMDPNVLVSLRPLDRSDITA